MFVTKLYLFSIETIKISTHIELVSKIANIHDLNITNWFQNNMLNGYVF
jgi:hypothetical protein